MKLINIVFFFFIFLYCHIGFTQDMTINNSIIKYHLGWNFNLKIEKEISMTIHNERGIKHSIYYDYQDKFKKIINFSYQIYDEENNLVKTFRKSDAIDLMYNASYEIDDTRRFIMDPSYQVYPFHVKIKVTSNQNGYMNLPIWMPKYDNGIEIKRSELHLYADKDFEFKMSVTGNINKSVVDVLAGGRIHYRWTVQNLDPDYGEIKYNAFYNKQAKLSIAPRNYSYDGVAGSFESWVTFGDWFYDLNFERNSLSIETMTQVNRISFQDLPKKEIIKLLYNFMQDRTRYVSIQLGIGGFQSERSEKVDKDGYGDCKALTNYMKSLLYQAAIESNYILVNAGKDKIQLNDTFPSSQFNHVFLGVPLEEDTIYLECTSQDQPFGYLGSFTDDRSVLWVEKGGSKIIKSPKYDEKINNQRTKSQINIDINGDAKISNVISRSGYFYDTYSYLEYLNVDQIVKFNIGEFSYKDFSIIDFSYAKHKEDLPSYVGLFSLEVNNLARNVANKLVLNYNLLEPIDTYINVYKYAKFVEIGRSFLLEDEVVITTPLNVYMNEIPDDIAFSNNYGSYNISFSRQLDKVIVKRRVKIKEGVYQKVDFDEFYSFYKKIISVDRKKMVFSIKT